MKEDYRVDPRNIHVDQRKKDTRREAWDRDCLLYTSPSPRDGSISRMPSSA